MATVFLVDVKFDRLLEAEGIQIAVNQHITAVGPNGKEYAVFVASVGGRNFFVHGWESFLRGNNMVDGTPLLCMTSRNGTYLTARVCDGSYCVTPVGNWEFGSSSNEIPASTTKNQGVGPKIHMAVDVNTVNEVLVTDDELSEDDDEPPSKKPFRIPLLRANFHRGLVLDRENKWRSPPKGWSVVIIGPGGEKTSLAPKRARNCLSDGCAI